MFTRLRGDECCSNNAKYQVAEVLRKLKHPTQEINGSEVNTSLSDPLLEKDKRVL